MLAGGAGDLDPVVRSLVAGVAEDLVAGVDPPDRAVGPRADVTEAAGDVHPRAGVVVGVAVDAAA